MSEITRRALLGGLAFAAPLVVVAKAAAQPRLGAAANDGINWIDPPYVVIDQDANRGIPEIIVVHAREQIGDKRVAYGVGVRVPREFRRDVVLAGGIDAWRTYINDVRGALKALVGGGNRAQYRREILEDVAIIKLADLCPFPTCIARLGYVPYI